VKPRLGFLEWSEDAFAPSSLRLRFSAIVACCCGCVLVITAYNNGECMHARLRKNWPGIDKPSSASANSIGGRKDMPKLGETTSPAPGRHDDERQVGACACPFRSTWIQHVISSIPVLSLWLEDGHPWAGDRRATSRLVSSRPPAESHPYISFYWHIYSGRQTGTRWDYACSEVVICLL
jgi:hypothetical protein